jgi:hypothetical protein
MRPYAHAPSHNDALVVLTQTPSAPAKTGPHGAEAEAVGTGCSIRMLQKCILINLFNFLLTFFVK